MAWASRGGPLGLVEEDWLKESFTKDLDCGQRLGLGTGWEKVRDLYVLCGLSEHRAWGGHIKAVRLG